MSKPQTLMWFRQDLRLQDNPALSAAVAAGEILPLYILDDMNPGEWTMGGASRWWLHESLQSLNKSLSGNLLVLAGDPKQLLPKLISQQGITKIVWNRCYEPWQIKRDRSIKEALTDLCEVESFNGAMLWEPWTNLKADGTPYRVFTPYYKHSIKTAPERDVLKVNPKAIKFARLQQDTSNIDDLNLLPAIAWHLSIAEHWHPGEAGAYKQLEKFVDVGLENYKTGRDFPALNSVSRLSPHLHFGEISANQVWLTAMAQAGNAPENEIEHFQRELAWREFSYYLLYHFPTISNQNLYSQFDRFPWLKDDQSLQRWQRGETGFPLVDAGMRELWQTGYMHNRVRMIVGSFLVKNLLLHWLEGARWFWDCLVDADLASNSASWQWVAGSGADASPYFRVFNPHTQSLKFDGAGEYIKHYVPELKGLDGKSLHDPSSAPPIELVSAGVTLDKDYPRAMLDLKETRVRALEAYATIRK
ncbi:MAG: deoxyribodipyrimidine photo-lyase [Pseudohongiellaceae bacterium]